MQNEIWKDIPGYAGLYQVSNTGRVKSFKNQYGHGIRILAHQKKVSDEKFSQCDDSPRSGRDMPDILPEGQTQMVV